MSRQIWDEPEDGEVSCPGCWEHFTPDELCEHDGEHGPLCPRCCDFWHDDQPTEAA